MTITVMMTTTENTTTLVPTPSEKNNVNVRMMVISEDDDGVVKNESGVMAMEAMMMRRPPAEKSAVNDNDDEVHTRSKAGQDDKRLGDFLRQLKCSGYKKVRSHKFCVHVCVPCFSYSANTFSYFVALSSLSCIVMRVDRIPTTLFFGCGRFYCKKICKVFISFP